MRGAKFELDEYHDCSDYDDVTDSCDLDPYTLVSRDFPIGGVTEAVARVLFPKLNHVKSELILKWYCEKAPDEIETAWRKALAEHDEENPPKG